MSAAALVSVRLRCRRESTAASLVPRMLMVTEVSGAVGAGDSEGVGVGGAGDELVVRASWRCRSRRRRLSIAKVP